MNIYTISILKIFLSVLVGSFMGMEREKAGKPAGIKTHSLVCLGGTMITIVGILTYKDTGAGDPMRLSAQIVSGLGFLGAGVIMTRNNVVFGLTTAASLWFAGCMGICIGSEYTYLAIPCVLSYFLITKILSAIEVAFIRKDKKNEN